MHLTLLGLEPETDLSALWNVTLSDRLQNEPLGDDLGEYSELADVATGQPVLCRICGLNRWHKEGPVWVCDEHPAIDLLPVRVLDSKKAELVIAVKKQ